jgi:hypothetical protein
MIHHCVFYRLREGKKGDKAVVDQIVARTTQMAKDIGLAESFATGPPTPETVQAAQVRSVRSGWIGLDPERRATTSWCARSVGKSDEP